MTIKLIMRAQAIRTSCMVCMCSRNVCRLILPFASFNLRQASSIVDRMPWNIAGNSSSCCHFPEAESTMGFGQLGLTAKSATLQSYPIQRDSAQSRMKPSPGSSSSTRHVNSKALNVYAAELTRIRRAKQKRSVSALAGMNSFSSMSSSLQLSYVSRMALLQARHELTRVERTRTASAKGCGSLSVAGTVKSIRERASLGKTASRPHCSCSCCRTTSFHAKNVAPTMLEDHS